MNKLNADILKLLNEDSRYGAEKIAVMLGEDKKTVADGIAALERAGVIVKYNVLVNEDKADSGMVQAWIEVKVTPQKTLGFDSIAEEIYRFPEVRDLYLMSGGYDLAVLIEGKTLKDVAMFVSEKLSAMETVTGTATHFVLKKYKVGGVELQSGEPLKRLAVHE
jgi:DNA-binding Lrp family transcriptional regulator